MQSFSIYRGQADKGVGEGPGLEVAHGEQYLAADGPLYDKDLLAAIRPWMTLDLDPLDERALGDRLEGWSCFSEGAYSFVARLTPAGRYEQRTAYFAHGRAWHRSVWEQGVDAGGALGDAAAFERPWRGSERPQPLQPPAGRLAGIDLVRAAPQTAIRLLAHLLESVLHDTRVLMAVPVEDFQSGGPLHAHVALARAALPFHLKRLCRIRIYTRRPRFFLGEAGAHLVAVPRDEAESARSLSGLRLLDREGRLQRGQATSVQAMNYAQAVVEQACRRPDGLFDFSRRVEGLVREPERLAALSAQQILRIYRISGASTNLEEDLPKALEAPQEFPWELVSDADLRRLSPSAWAEILLARSGSSSSLAELQQRTLQMLSSKEFPHDRRHEVREQLESGWTSRAASPLSAIELEKLSAHLNAGLVSDAFAAPLSLKAPLSEIEGLSDPAPLLNAELLSGLLPKRRLGNPELSRLAANPSLAAVLAEGLLRRTLPSGWVVGWLAESSPHATAAFAQRFLGHQDAFLQRPDLYPALLERLLQFERLPARLLQPLRQAAEQLESADDLPAAFQVVELRRRAGDRPSDQQLNRLWNRLGSIHDSQTRRSLVRQTLQESWQSLDPQLLVREDGSLGLPDGWEPDVADLLLAADPPSGRLNLPTAMRLCDLLSEGQEECRRRLAQRIDHLASEADWPSLTADLLRYSGWGQWRRRSRLGPDVLRQAAWAWLTNPMWRSGQAVLTPIEDWEQVVSDLGSRPLTAPEAEALFEGDCPRWPWILPFQNQQIEDLARISADWDALAVICERLPEESVPYRLRRPLSEVLQQGFDFPAPLPDDFLGRLCRLGSHAPPLLPTAEALTALFPVEGPSPLGRRADLLRQSLRQDAFESLQDGPPRFEQGLQAARFLGLEEDPEFLTALSEALKQQAQAGSDTGISEEALDVLDTWLAGAADLPDERHSEQAGLYFLSRGKKRVAGFLCPDVLEGEAVLQCLDCLAEGRSEHPCWAELARSIQAAPQHPAARMARILRRRARRMDSQQRLRLLQNGWKTFRAASAQHVAWTSDQAGGSGTLLPVLELAAVLQPERGLGNLAVEVVEMAGRNPRMKEAGWWAELVQGLEGCPRLDGLASADDWPEAAYAVLSSAVRANSRSGHLDVAWRRRVRHKEKGPTFSALVFLP